MPTSRDRPSHRDDDVVWLAERAAGITHTQGVGTEANEIPRGVPASPVTHYLRADITGQSATSEVVLQMPATTRAWRLKAVTTHPTAGTATMYGPRIGQTPGFDFDGPDDRWAIFQRSVGAALNASYCSPIPMRADELFRLYLHPVFDAGADNELTYQFWFEQDFGTEESTA